MLLNKAGETIEFIYLKIPIKYKNIILHEYMIMPNHLHGIIEVFNGSVGADSISAQNIDSRADMESAPTKL